MTSHVLCLHGVRGVRCRVFALRGQRTFSGLLGGFGDASDMIGDVPNKRDAQLAEVLGFVKKGRMDRALQLAAPLAEAVDAAPAQFLAEQCSQRAAAAYCNSKEAQEMAVQLVVAGTAFDIPGRDVNLIRPRQLVEGFWLRKVSDVYDMADGCRRLAKAALALGGETWPHAARDWQLHARCSVIRVQTCQSQAVLQAYIGKRIQGDGSLLPRLPALWAIFVKSGTHLRESLLSPEPVGPLDESEVPSETSADFWRLQAERRQRAAAKQMEILTECISEAATSLFNVEDGLDLLNVAEGMFKVDCPPELRQTSLKILRATATALKERG